MPKKHGSREQWKVMHSNIRGQSYNEGLVILIYITSLGLGPWPHFLTINVKNNFFSDLKFKFLLNSEWEI